MYEDKTNVFVSRNTLQLREQAKLLLILSIAGRPYSRFLNDRNPSGLLILEN